MTSDLKSEIAKTFSGQIGDKKIVSVSVIYASEMSGGYKETDRVEQLYGPGYYEEVLLGITFRVSPFAFFQVNTPVFEAMLQKIKDFA